MASKKTDDETGRTKTTTKPAKTRAGSGEATAKKPGSSRAGKSEATAGSGSAKTASRKGATTKRTGAKKVTLKKAAKKATVRRGARTAMVVTPAVAPRKEPASKRVALAIADAALEKKAVNVQIIDVYGKVDYADYLVVMSGRSDRQVSALARGIAEDVERTVSEKCAGIEGLPEGAWVLMDFGDVVVHIFHDDVRGYYDLESLWIDAARVPVPNQAPG